MLPSRCSSARQGKGQAPSECSLGWGWAHPGLGCLSGGTHLGPFTSFCRAIPTCSPDRAGGSSGHREAQWRGEKLPRLEGSSCSPTVGTSLGQKYGHPDDLSGPHGGHVPTPAHIRMRSQHAPLTPRAAPVLIYRSGRRGGARTRGHEKDTSFPAWSVPTSPPLQRVRGPATHFSFILTHTLRLLARPPAIFGTSCKMSCFPAGGNAWFERDLFQRREGSCLPGGPPFFFRAPRCPGGPP